MAFNFSRLKSWLGYENISNTDLNAEFNNVISKAGADTLSSANSTAGSTPSVSSMQVTSNPGGVGSENLSLTTQTDIQQLRFVAQEITGGAQWYSAPALSLSQLSGIATAPSSRVISGRVNPNGYKQPAYLVADGTAATVYLKATSTNFSAYFNNVFETFTTDITLSGLSTAPASNNTCLVTDAALSGAVATRVQGESSTSITIGTIGSNITSLDGKFAAFKHSTEYFIAQIENGTTTYAAPTAVTGVAISGTTVSTSTTLTGLSSTVGLYSGMTVTGTNIPANTTISGIGSTTVTLSNAATGSATNTMTFLGTQLTSVSSLTAISVGMTVTGTGIPANTLVTAIGSDPLNGNTITLSNATTAAGSSITCTFVWFRLKNAFRGVGFNSSDSWLARTAISNGDTITLMKLAWVFATYASSTPGITPVYNEPTVSYTAPTSPSTGDYWYNISTSTWTTYSGSAFVATTAVFVGICIQNTTGCVAARSTDFFQFFSDLNTLEPAAKDLTDIYVPSLNSKISVYGTPFYFDKSQPLWNTTNNLAPSASLLTSTTYYCYITSYGDLFIDTIQPTLSRKQDLLGAYHPQYPWRCVCDFGTDGSSNILPASVNYANYHQKSLPSSGNTVFSPNTIPGAAIQNSSITGTQIAAGAVSAAKRALPGQVIGSSSGAYTNTSTSVPSTACSVTITTTGRPVLLMFQPDGTATSDSCIGILSSASTARFTILRDGVIISTGMVLSIETTGTPGTLYPPGFMNFLDTGAAAGAHTYSLQAVIRVTNTGTATVTNVVMVAFEL